MLAQVRLRLRRAGGGGRELLGGKGIGLAEMTQLGLPVPAGFTITTDACRATWRRAVVRTGSRTSSTSTSARLEARTGKRFGDPDDPLLVSVRSGAAISMPGMMDTILNLGLNDAAAEGLAARDRQPRASPRLLPAADPDVRRGRRRARRAPFEHALDDLKRERGVGRTRSSPPTTCASWSTSSGSTPTPRARVPAGCA